MAVIYIQNVSEDLAARFAEFMKANEFSNRSAAGKFLLNRALIAEGFGAAITPETLKAAGVE